MAILVCHNADVDFDYTVMKSGIEYSRTQYNAILKLYENYNKRLRQLCRLCQLREGR